MNRNELLSVQERLLAYMESTLEDMETDMIFFMLTDILKESTRLLFVGKDAKTVVENSFHLEAEENYIDLEGVVSRKKQLIPKLTAGLQG